MTDIIELAIGVFAYLIVCRVADNRSPERRNWEDNR
jgi:hypothetical protein